uniref:Asc-type amino acid transporter 1 n=1 Tax=Oncorhynchus tshawytscha TaxID=74940 RepID=A0AAZ3NWZ3_ONCTS
PLLEGDYLPSRTQHGWTGLGGPAIKLTSTTRECISPLHNNGGQDRTGRLSENRPAIKELTECNIIGSGIFISPKGVLEHAGSVGLSLIVWVCGGGICALGSMCYAELGVTIPKSGGDYSYVTEIFGGLVGFLLLWSAVLIMYPTTLAVIALTFSNYVLQPAFQNCVPPYLATRLLSTICILFLTWVNCSSVRWATRIQDVFTVAKLLALGLIIAVGLVQICRGHYDALRPSQAFEFTRDPSVGQIALAFLQASFAFSGWNFLNYVTEEVVEPRKNLPRAIYISIPLVTLVYTLTNIAYFSSMTPEELLASNAVAVTFGEKLLGVFSWVMPISVALSTFGGINGYLFTSSRLCFSGAREGHLPYLLAMIHLKNCTPIPALLVCCGATIVILCIGETHNLINYVSFINFLSYGVTIAGLLYYRWKRPNLLRPIKVSVLVPISYLVFWAVLLGFSLYSEPVVCGMGIYHHAHRGTRLLTISESTGRTSPDVSTGSWVSDSYTPCIASPCRSFTRRS